MVAYPTLITLAQNTGQTEIINSLIQHSPTLGAMPIATANRHDHNVADYVVKMGTAEFRAFNEGVGISTNEYRQTKEYMSMLLGYSEVDWEMILKSPPHIQSRELAKQRDTHIEGIGDKLSEAFWYGNSLTDARKFDGMTIRYNSKSDNLFGKQIIDAGGTGSDNTSIWLLGMGKGCKLIHPPGVQTGGGVRGLDTGTKLVSVSAEGDGLGVTIKEDNGKMHQVFRHQYKADIGLNVDDWRYNVRIANIDVSDLNNDASGSSADLIDLLEKARLQMFNFTGITPVFVMHRNIQSVIKSQARNFKRASLDTMEIMNTKTDGYSGIPFMIDDKLSLTEPLVS